MSKKLIILDPGHGQFGNPHTTREGFFEGTQNFILASHLRDELVSRGFNVKMTRERVEENPSLEDRGSMAGKLGAVMFLSIHSNAPGGDPKSERYTKIRGSETYYSITDEACNADIARALNDAVVATMQTEDRGIKTRRYPDRPDWDYYGVIRAAAQSGCTAAFLIEHGFHTNPRDSAFLQDDACLCRLAVAEADVIARIFA
ncbi:MAG: N-acetylmuramoyl-L-alanine amidase [Clostridia bacterium]|nr:N-acetylmuramoyl-L-alanine amidase [Clostridia bacterium]